LKRPIHTNIANSRYHGSSTFANTFFTLWSTEPSPQQNASSSTVLIHPRVFHVGCHPLIRSRPLRLLSELHPEFHKPLHVAYQISFRLGL